MPTPYDIPDWYVTPNDVAGTRQYAQALLQGQPVRHWTQGLSNMVSALVGGNLMYDANRDEISTRKRFAETYGTNTYEPYLPPNQPTYPQRKAEGEAEPSFGDKVKTVYEVQPKKPTQPQAQPSRDERPAGLAFTPEQYVAPQYADQYRPGANSNVKPGGKDDKLKPVVNYMTDAMGFEEIDPKTGRVTNSGTFAPHKPQTPTQGAALPFARGPEAGQPAGFNSPQAMAKVLGQPQMAAAARSAPGGGSMPPASIGNPGDAAAGRLPPDYLPQRMRVDRGQLEEAISNPWADPEIKSQVVSDYRAQGQPIPIQGPGGTSVYSGVRPGAPPAWVPDLQKGNVKAGNTEVPYYGTFSPGGQFNQWGGGAPAAPARRPAPNDAMDLKFTNEEPTEGNIPSSALNLLPPEITQGRSLPRNMLPQAPVGGNAGGGGGEPGAGQQPQRMAQGQPSSPFDVQGWADFSRRNDVQTEYEKELAKHDSKDFTEDYASYTNNGKAAQQFLPEVRLARAALDSPKFKSGLFADPRLTVQRFKELVGKDKDAAIANEVFDKINSQKIVQDMKIMLQKLGQIRLAEIDLLAKATANKHNTVEANKIVMDLVGKAYERAYSLGRVANDYKRGVRWDDEGNKQPYLAQGSGTKAELDHYIMNYTSRHPIVDPKEEAALRERLTADESVVNKTAQQRKAEYARYRDILKTYQDATRPGGAGSEPAGASPVPSGAKDTGSPKPPSGFK